MGYPLRAQISKMWASARRKATSGREALNDPSVLASASFGGRASVEPAIQQPPWDLTLFEISRLCGRLAGEMRFVMCDYA